MMPIVTDRPHYRGSVKSAGDFWSQRPAIVIESDNAGCAMGDIWEEPHPETDEGETGAGVGSAISNVLYITEVQYDEAVFERLLALDGKTPNVPFDGDDDL